MAEWTEEIAGYDSRLATFLMDRLLQWLPGAIGDYVVESNESAAWVRIKTAREDVSDADLGNVLAEHGALVLSVDTHTIAADGVAEATITCNDAAIAVDTHVDYEVRREGEVVSEADATEVVAAGSVSLEFSTAEVGVYVIEVARQGADEYDTGYVIVEAV